MEIRISKFLTNDFTVLAHIAIICIALLINMGSTALYFGLTVVSFTLWSKQWDWSYLSFTTLSWAKATKYAVIWIVPVYVLVVAISYVVETVFGKMNLSDFDAIKGNPMAFIMILLYSWVSAALGEEVFFRGYVLNRIKDFFEGSKTGTFLALLLSSIIFSFGHLYQGVPGVVTTFLIGMILGALF